MYLDVFLVPTVNFSQSSYSVNENEKMIDLPLLLSNPLSTDITVEVFSTNESATGEH